ncbi:MAG: AI-2E family transporter [Acidobacteriota bacterium]|nr:AI-2E family transporter [Acidobacteriota bacterium]
MRWPAPVGSWWRPCAATSSPSIPIGSEGWGRPQIAILPVLQIPLAVPIFILYFFTSFIPFVGAWIAGAFAVLIAFGSGGVPAAVIIAVTILVSNGGIQSAVGSWALGTSLKMHPISVLLATIVGGTVAGIIGMVLGAPLLAAVIRSVEVLTHHRVAGGLDPDKRANLLAPTSSA